MTLLGALWNLVVFKSLYIDVIDTQHAMVNGKNNIIFLDDFINECDGIMKNRQIIRMITS